MVTNCGICGKEMKVQPKRIRRLKHGVLSCSRECAAKHRSEFFTGENNHQFGLTGHKNSSFKPGLLVDTFGYLYEYCPGHPRANHASRDGSRIRQHRLIVERNHHLFYPEYFEEIKGWIVLKPMYDVHHINEDKQDNRLENLEILSRSEHTMLHNLEKSIIREPNTGRILGIIKHAA